MRDYNEAVYMITIEDIQNVAERDFGRELTDAEIDEIAHKIGDYIDWHEAIRNQIEFRLNLEPLPPEEVSDEAFY